MTGTEEDGQRAVLHEELRHLWSTAGGPSARALSRDIGGISHTTIAGALSGKLLPSRGKMILIVEALGGSWEHFEPLYPKKTPRVATYVASSSVTLDTVLEEVRAIRTLLEGMKPSP